MERYKGYKFRLYPNKEQQKLLGQHFGACRWIYNYGLNKKIEVYTKEKKTLSRFDLQKELPSLKKQEETSWLGNVAAQSLQSSLHNLDRAYTRFFREKKGFPNFKKKHGKQSCHFPQGSKIDFENNKLYVTKFQEGINCVFSRQFGGEIKNVIISKTTTGKYFASILVKEEVFRRIKTKPERETALGIDLGLKSFIVTSKNQVFENPRFLRKSLNKLKREQRKLSRKQKGSNNRNKQRLRLARVHEKVTNQRKDHLHKITRQLVDDNQVQTFCLETLNIQGMKKNHRLALSISDAGWTTFVQFLTYKAEWKGKRILRIGRFEPSSRACNQCGLVNDKLTLKDRTWVCECGAEHDRDFLAACNIRDFAFHKQNLIGQGVS